MNGQRLCAAGAARRLMLAGALATMAACAGAAAASELTVGSPAPQIRAQLHRGGTFDLAAARGKVVLLNFWATWCPPCRKEMPVLEALQRKYAKDGLVVLAVSIDNPSDTAQVRAVLQRFSFAAALPGEARTAGYGRPARVPMTFVIDREGLLRFDGWRSSRPLDARDLEQIVAPLLHSARS